MNFLVMFTCFSVIILLQTRSVFNLIYSYINIICKTCDITVETLSHQRRNDKKGANSGINEPRHEISKNVVYVTSKGSDQPAHTRSLVKAFASRLNIS